MSGFLMINELRFSVGLQIVTVNLTSEKLVPDAYGTYH